MDTEKARRTNIASRLAAGTASERDRDDALAEILLSLWSEDDLDKRIDNKVHLCYEQHRCRTQISLAGVFKTVAGFFTS